MDGALIVAIVAAVVAAVLPALAIYFASEANKTARQALYLAAGQARAELGVSYLARSKELVIRLNFMKGTHKGGRLWVTHDSVGVIEFLALYLDSEANNLFNISFMDILKASATPAEYQFINSFRHKTTKPQYKERIGGNRESLELLRIDRGDNNKEQWERLKILIKKLLSNKHLFVSYADVQTTEVVNKMKLWYFRPPESV